MAEQPYQVPDLASILATLARYTPGALPTSTPPQAQAPAINRPPETSQGPHALALEANSSPSLLSAQEKERSSAPSPPVIDPATILDWPAALRCVTKTVGRNDQAIVRIKKMIQTQNEHEAQWWKAREELIENQRIRTKGRIELNEILGSIGGAQIADVTDGTTEEDKANELSLYDKKVLRASQQMVNAMSDELRRLGIPFFGVPDRLIRKIGDADVPGSQAQARIGEDELRALQRRMISLLEDLTG